MDSSQMQELVDRHMSAENHGDIDGAVAVCTDDAMVLRPRWSIN